MTQRIITNDDELRLLKVYLDGKKLPFTVEIADGRDRSREQNKLAWKWYGEISEQTGEEVEDVRAGCKLRHGIPILRRDIEAFKETYDRVLRPLPEMVKRDFIRDTQMQVTSLMKVKQMTEYLDLVFRHHAEFGIVLTIPPDRFAFNPERRKAA